MFVQLLSVWIHMEKVNVRWRHFDELLAGLQRTLARIYHLQAHFIHSEGHYKLTLTQTECDLSEVLNTWVERSSIPRLVLCLQTRDWLLAFCTISSSFSSIRCMFELKLSCSFVVVSTLWILRDSAFWR